MVTPTQRSLQIIDGAEISATKSLVAAGNYGGDDVLSESASAGTVWTFSGASLQPGGMGEIVKAVLVAETTALVVALDLFLYNAAPTCNLNDNVVSDQVLWADRAAFLGKITFPALAADVAGAAAVSQAVPQTAASNIPFTYVTGAAKDIYGVLTSPVAFTNEAAGEDIIIKLMVERYG